MAFKLFVSLYENGTEPSVQGTIERWQAGSDFKTVSTFGSSVTTHVEHDGKGYTLVAGAPVTDAAMAALAGVLHPGPYPDDAKGAKPDLRKQDFGKISLDCIMLSRPLLKGAHPPLGLFPTYCLTQADQFLVSYDFGSQTVLRSAVDHFLDHDVTTADSILEGQRLLATGKVITLSTFQPKPDEFEPTPDLLASTEGAHVDASVMAGGILTKVSPHYPEAARGSHTTGTVILAALIGVDGHVHSLRLISAPDPDLAESAIAATRQWTYTPYLLNGIPTAVHTTITVNYDMR